MGKKPFNSMGVTPLHDPSNGQMRVVGLMSGFGSNLTEIIKHEKNLGVVRRKSPYTVVGIFTNNPHSSAQTIGSHYDIMVVSNPYKEFCKKIGLKRKDESARIQYDELTLEMVQAIDATVAAFAGYELYATKVLTENILGINVHPADLTLRKGDGSPKYGGYIRHGAIESAINAGEKEVRSSTHIVEEELDGGRVLMRSAPVQVDFRAYAGVSEGKKAEYASRDLQALLKEKGDWKIFPKTLELIADGRFGQDEKGRLYFDNKLIPQGIEWEEQEHELR